jgi:queuine/archaeosine tRNA-ribosyltransferase
MKSLCVVLLLGLGMSSCSMLSKTGRMDRAYYKQLKQVKNARAKERKQTIKKQAKIPSPDTPPPLDQTVQPPPENQ